MVLSSRSICRSICCILARRCVSRQGLLLPEALIGHFVLLLVVLVVEAALVLRRHGLINDCLLLKCTTVFEGNVSVAGRGVFTELRLVPIMLE